MNLKFLVPWFLLSILAFAKAPLMQPQNQGDVSFVSGGIGGEGRDAMQTLSANYNLHLLFSQKATGAYPSDVKVTILDERGNTVMETMADGPILFAKLNSGRYTVIADWNEHSIGKTANVTSQHQTALSFAWPQQCGY